MEDNIIDLTQYKNALDNKKKLDSREITVDDLTLEELEDVQELYLKEINTLNKNIQELTRENEALRGIKHGMTKEDLRNRLPEMLVEAIRYNDVEFIDGSLEEYKNWDWTDCDCGIDEEDNLVVLGIPLIDYHRISSIKSHKPINECDEQDSHIKVGIDDDSFFFVINWYTGLKISFEGKERRLEDKKYCKYAIEIIDEKGIPADGFWIKDGLLFLYTGPDEGEVIIPKGVKVISEYVFSDLNDITSIVLPDSVKEIEEGAFRSTGIIKMDLNKTEIVGADVFLYCNKLKEITLPSSLKHLDKNFLGWTDYSKRKGRLLINNYSNFDTSDFVND